MCLPPEKRIDEKEVDRVDQKGEDQWKNNGDHPFGALQASLAVLDKGELLLGTPFGWQLLVRDTFAVEKAVINEVSQNKAKQQCKIQHHYQKREKGFISQLRISKRYTVDQKGKKRVEDQQDQISLVLAYFRSALRFAFLFFHTKPF